MRGRPPKVRPPATDSPINATPSMPRDLDAIAKKKWKAICKELAGVGIMTLLDGDILADYCRTFSEEQKAVALLAQAPNPFLLADDEGHMYLNPLRRELAKIRDHLHRLRQELGLGPVSRTRLDVSAAKKAKAPASKPPASDPPRPEIAGKIG